MPEQTAPPRGVTRVSPNRADPGTGPVTLTFEDLSMIYPDGTQALSGIDLEIAQGEFVSIIGPSGCGKSTLARIASGLLSQTEGTVRIDRDHLAFTFQEPTLLPWRRVLENVELMMELRGVPAAARRAKAEEQIALVGLEGFEDRYPRQLSGGMKMRASLARSLALDPTVFLFDEPFGALDEITRERLIDELAALHRAKGFTGFFITHSIPEAVYLSTRVAVMSARPGRIEAMFEIDLPEPRSHDLRYDEAFTEGCAEISHALRTAMGPTGTGT